MLIKRFIEDESGVTAIEYAVIGVAMAAVLGVALGTNNDEGLRGAINRAFLKIENMISEKPIGS
ncbi:Flp family type IVb pilin [Vibrio europaeus]|uniref:Flp family type IVb pilin n=1 Tax=Vibrio europaeus TaxID=300876 RepID=UPI00148D5403|nr:Flp family type IVb pilin [Vibrio europaeus]NOH21839.1 Flp family type IVb pilin [Vibrio europaeus]